jgi:hypothetical protein
MWSMASSGPKQESHCTFKLDYCTLPSSPVWVVSRKIAPPGSLFQAMYSPSHTRVRAEDLEGATYSIRRKYDAEMNDV